MRKKRKIGVRDIAAETGLNISTVSRALRGSRQISPETASIVLQTAHQLGYQPGDRVRTVVLLLPEFSVRLGFYSMNILNAMRDEIHRRGWRLEIFNSDQCDLLDERGICGVISSDFNNKLAERLGSSRNLPVVCINDVPRHIDGIYTVFSDENTGVTRAVDGLADYGHKRIGMIIAGRPDSMGTVMRTDCFHSRIAERGIEGFLRFSATRHSLCDIVIDLVEHQVTGIISPGETDSARVYAAIRDCGLRIPEDISFISWEVPGISELFPPGLTTLAQNFPMLACRALDLLDDLIAGKNVYRDVRVPYLYHERDSVGFPGRLRIVRESAEKKEN